MVPHHSDGHTEIGDLRVGGIRARRPSGDVRVARQSCGDGERQPARLLRGVPWPAQRRETIGPRPSGIVEKLAWNMSVPQPMRRTRVPRDSAPSEASHDDTTARRVASAVRVGGMPVPSRANAISAKMPAPIVRTFHLLEGAPSRCFRYTRRVDGTRPVEVPVRLTISRPLRGPTSHRRWCVANPYTSIVPVNPGPPAAT